MDWRSRRPIEGDLYLDSRFEGYGKVLKQMLQGMEAVEGLYTSQAWFQGLKKSTGLALDLFCPWWMMCGDGLRGRKVRCVLDLAIITH